MTRLYLIIGIVAALAISHVTVYMVGRSHGKTKEIVKELKAEVEGEEQREEITKEVIRLPATELRRRYCEWVRDDKDLCLEADIPIP